MDDDRLYTLAEVAAYLRVHPVSVRRWLRAGTLDGAHVGRDWRIAGRAVAAFLAERRGKPTLRRRVGDDYARPPNAPARPEGTRSDPADEEA